jgi:hypothetical protein
VTVITDAPYHVAGDLAKVRPAGTIKANDLNGVIDPNEDYPTIAGLKSVLLETKVKPLFLVTSDVEASYKALALSLNEGVDNVGAVVVTLDKDSANIADAIKFAVAKANKTISPGGEGTDAPDIIDDRKLTPGGNKVVFAGGGNDLVDLSKFTGKNFIDGGAGFDKIYGGIGQDKADGGSGNDTITGGQGDDILLGSAGNDILVGDSDEMILFGNDTLQGDSGNDILTGGKGNDTFVFDSGLRFLDPGRDTLNKGNPAIPISDLGIDTITDFQTGIDKIELSRDTFTLLPLGQTTLSSFESVPGGLSAAKASGALIVYDQDNARLYYNPNGSLTTGSGFGSSIPAISPYLPTGPEGVLFAKFNDGDLLSASDFTVVDVF